MSETNIFCVCVVMVILVAIQLVTVFKAQKNIRRAQDRLVEQLTKLTESPLLLRSIRPPCSADLNYETGTIWHDVTHNEQYLLNEVLAQWIKIKGDTQCLKSQKQ